MAFNYSIAFWIILIILLLFMIVAIIIGMIQSAQIPQVIDSQFRFSDKQFKHLGETNVTILIHMTYAKNVKDSKIAKRTDVSNVIDSVGPAIDPNNTELWERTAQDMALRIWKAFDVYGVSVEVIIPVSAADPSITQTATFTKGYISRNVKMDKPQ